METYLIFDIGKTNKKIVLYDLHLNIFHEESTVFQELVDDDGFPCDDLKGISDWILNKAAYFIHHPGYQIKGINFSAYGASLVNLDEKGQVCTPFYNYLKPIEEEIWNDFLDEQPDLLLKTASPALRMLNSGFQLYWLMQKKPGSFNKITLSLHFPQYLSFLFSQQGWDDHCSLGSHTVLWDYRKNGFAEWVTSMKVDRLFPPLPAHLSRQIEWSGKTFQLGNGIHDSSAALIPYRSYLREPFVLISTGTWSISMNPFDHVPVDKEDLANDCLCYLQPDGQTVKGARIFLGKEYEEQVKRMARRFQCPLEKLLELTFSDEALIRFFQENQEKGPVFSPVAMGETGPVSLPKGLNDPLAKFNSPEMAYLHMMLDLVKWQRISTDWVLKKVDAENLIVSGGFVKNRIYLVFLQLYYPAKKIHTSEQSKASSLGAAMLVSNENPLLGGILQLKKLKIDEYPS